LARPLGRSIAQTSDADALLPPPDFKGDAPTGYIVVRAQTYNGYALFRAIPNGSSEADLSKANALAKKITALSFDQCG
jgi:hypothetical protein